MFTCGEEKKYPVSTYRQVCQVNIMVSAYFIHVSGKLDMSSVEQHELNWRAR